MHGTDCRTSDDPVAASGGAWGPSVCRALLHALLILVPAGGCGQHREPAAAPRDPALIGDEETSHDFGTVVTPTRRDLEHPYRLKNTTSHVIEITDVINRKPCCGDVLVGRRVLQPGEDTTVSIRLRVGTQFGTVLHEAAVLTDPPPDRELVLRTMARAHPALRVENVSPWNRPVLAGNREPRQAAYLVVASGTPDEPCVDLSRSSLEGSIPAEWDGPKRDGPPVDDLITESRRFLVTLDPTGASGERSAEVILREGGETVLSCPIQWEVVAQLTPEPKVVVLKSRSSTARVVIRSFDRQAFRITRVESPPPGLAVRAVGREGAPIQIIEAEGVPSSGDARGVVTVFTDHPEQDRLDLPFVVIP